MIPDPSPLTGKHIYRHAPYQPPDDPFPPPARADHGHIERRLALAFWFLFALTAGALLGWWLP